MIASMSRPYFWLCFSTSDVEFRQKFHRFVRILSVVAKTPDSQSGKPGSIPGPSDGQPSRNWYLASFGDGEGKAATERR